MLSALRHACLRDGRRHVGTATNAHPAMGRRVTLIRDAVEGEKMTDYARRLRADLRGLLREAKKMTSRRLTRQHARSSNASYAIPPVN